MKHKEGKFSFLKVIYSLGFCLEDTERYILKCSKVNALIVVGLKLNIQKTKIMAYSPITSWEIDGETVETVSEFIFLLKDNCFTESCFLSNLNMN